MVVVEMKVGCLFEKMRVWRCAEGIYDIHDFFSLYSGNEKIPVVETNSK